ncbi:MAG: protein translocase subunit SecD [Chloroflexota bacterium]
MTKNKLIALTLIIIIFGLALWVLLPLEGKRLGRQGMRLGLDLVGGVHLVYQADFPEGTAESEQKSDTARAVDIISRRINELGVTGPIIQQQGNDRIVVRLPGYTDIEAAKAEVEKTAFLEFRQAELNESGLPVYLKDYLEDGRTGFFNTKETGTRFFMSGPGQPLVAILTKAAAGNLAFTDRNGATLDTGKLKARMDQLMLDFPGDYPLLSWIPARGNNGVQLTGDFLSDAQPNILTQTSGAAQAVVAIWWNKQGTTIFDDIAGRLYFAGPDNSPQRALGIFLDRSLISYPQIRQAKYEGKAQIEGNFTSDEATQLARLLRSGSLPLPLEKPPLYEETISATLGSEFIGTSIKAGLIGMLMVMLFMIIYYRLPGFVASLALVFYGALVLALFKLIPVTLTLAGIGGFVLSIGLAVDANVLIFERMREELRAGRSLGAAIEAGFNRAWTAIRDSNITTFIVCIILYWLGSSIVASAPVMGFALTLAIGVAVSMFTAITVTRSLLRVFTATGLVRHHSLYITDTGKK